MIKKLDPISIIIGIMFAFSVLILIEDFYVQFTKGPPEDNTRFNIVSRHHYQGMPVVVFVLEDGNKCWGYTSGGNIFGPIPCE